MQVRDILAAAGSKRVVWLCAGLLVLLATGVSLFFTPPYETMYNHRLLAPVTGKSGRVICFHILEIGNTGRRLQHNVDVLFSSRALTRAVMPLRARNYGKVDRQVAVSDDGATTAVSLGGLEPGRRVELQLVLQHDGSCRDLSWEDLCTGIRPARGDAVEGDPGFTLLGRALYDIFGGLL